MVKLTLIRPITFLGRLEMRFKNEKYVPDEPLPVDSDLYGNVFCAVSDPGVLGFTPS